MDEKDKKEIREVKKIFEDAGFELMAYTPSSFYENKTIKVSQEFLDNLDIVDEELVARAVKFFKTSVN